MTPNEIPAFEAELSDLFELLSHGKTTLSVRMVTLWFEALAPYPLAAVIAAMKAHQRHPDTGRTLPIPADIIKHVNAAIADDGRPVADEAWAIAAQSVDEGATVVWTAETAAAWGLASSVMALGDEVGARVAFRDAYNRLVTDARCDRRPVQWAAALGHDPARRADALRLAVDAGRLPRAHLNELQALPAPGGIAVRLLGGPSDGIARDADGRRGPTAEDRKRLAAALATIAAGGMGSNAAELDRQRTSELKANAAAKVRDFRSDDDQTS